jgi:hypothetical protein
MLVQSAFVEVSTARPRIEKKPCYRRRGNKKEEEEEEEAN